MDEGILIEKKKLIKVATALLAIMALFLVAKLITELREYKFIGQGVNSVNTISVSGEGEVFAVPDIAQFSFSINVTKDTVPEAQNEAARISNDVIKYLEGADVDERDIKTTNYSVYPSYEYVEIVCITFPCQPSKRELIGYEVNQSISIKVRDVDSVGGILSGVGNLGVTNLSGITFTIDDEDELNRDARKIAIEDAKGKAKELAKDLGVRLGKIVSFSEGGVYPSYARLDTAYGIGGESLKAVPDIPVGENKITSNITITYEIK